MCGILAKEKVGGQKETEFVGLSEEADEEPLSWANLYKAAINQAGAESFESVRSFTPSPIRGRRVVRKQAQDPVVGRCGART